MMIQQFIKTLNNTELGKGNAHETYVSVPKKSDIGLIFNPQKGWTDINLNVFDKISSLRLTNIRYGYKKANKEWRITGLGKYYRDNNVNAGDEIIFEKRTDKTNTDFYINLNCKTQDITFQKNTKGFEVLNLDRLKPLLIDDVLDIEVIYLGVKSQLLIEFKESSKKRSDSPNLTDFYDIKIDSISILDHFKKDEYIQLQKSFKKNILKRTTVWQSYEFNI